MAKPRIFISSTHYDLKNIRSDLERFIIDQGYESVLSEKGQIPYGNDKKLEEYCYKEIEHCDIVISIIGGRFGSEANVPNYSISNIELKTAFKQNKQVYIFIEKSVYSEYKTFEVNKDNKDVKYVSVDNSKVFDFIEEVQNTQINNQISPFETTFDITGYLRVQWAGLFQSLLKESSKQSEVVLIESLRKTADTLDQLVNYLKKDKNDSDSAIKDILLSNHPAFGVARGLLRVPYRIIFYNRKELNELLVARKFEEIDIFDGKFKENFRSWQDPRDDSSVLRINEEIFDENDKLKAYTLTEWKDNYIYIDKIQAISFDDFGDDIPF